MRITKNWAKYLTEALAGLAGGSILGMLSLIPGASYSSTICFPLIDKIFGSQGYESCGAFTAIIGILVGIIIAILLVRKFSKSNKITNIISIVTLIVAPFILGAVILGINNLEVVPPVILMFALLSIIPSIVITFLMNWRIFFDKKKNPTSS
jgi:hypothetical protein